MLFVLYVPLALLRSALLGLQGIFGAAATANGLAGITAYLWLRRMLAGDRLDQQVGARSEAGEELPEAGE
jgi:Na+-driven multidrug efflux pump